MSQTRCKDSINRRQNQIKKHFFYFFVYIPPILSLIINNQSSITHPLVHQPRPRRLDNRTMCVKHSQYYCVKLHEQPRRGVSLFASTEQPVYRLSPLYPEGKGDLGESGGAPLQVKRGRGSFRKVGTSPSRRGRVR